MSLPPPLLAVEADVEWPAGGAICEVCSSEPTAGSAMGLWRLRPTAGSKALAASAVRFPAARASATRASAATASPNLAFASASDCPSLIRDALSGADDGSYLSLRVIAFPERRSSERSVQTVR
jgi:hypothetical protein